MLTELERGLYTGTSKRSDTDGGDAWKIHILSPHDNGRETSQAYFFRLDYQEGIHCHSFNYLREPKRIKLE